MYFNDVIVTIHKLQNNINQEEDIIYGIELCNHLYKSQNVVFFFDFGTCKTYKSAQKEHGLKKRLKDVKCEDVSFFDLSSVHLLGS